MPLPLCPVADALASEPFCAHHLLSPHNLAPAPPPKIPLRELLLLCMSVLEAALLAHVRLAMFAGTIYAFLPILQSGPKYRCMRLTGSMEFGCQMLQL